MNNRYIFRGKGNPKYNDGEWYYGHLIYDSSDYQIVDPEYGSCRRTVIAETIGQCTGLTDKNGKLIFEGDVVRTKYYGKIIKNRNVADYDIFKVVYAYAMFRAENKNRTFNLIDGARYEIIGNIHDNPELLEVER